MKEPITENVIQKWSNMFKTLGGFDDVRFNCDVGLNVGKLQYTYLVQN